MCKDVEDKVVAVACAVITGLLTAVPAAGSFEAEMKKLDFEREKFYIERNWDPANNCPAAPRPWIPDTRPIGQYR